MAEYINEAVRIATSIQHNSIIPKHIEWKHRQYTCTRCTMHYSIYEGDVLLHIFLMTTKEACMQIALNTKTLLWTIQAIEAV